MYVVHQAFIAIEFRIVYTVSGLRGCDNNEQAAAEAMVNMIEDLRSYVLEKRGYYLLGMLDEAGRLEAENTLCEVHLPKLRKYLENNITGDQWLLSKVSSGSKIGIAWLFCKRCYLERRLHTLSPVSHTSKDGKIVVSMILRIDQRLWRIH